MKKTVFYVVMFGLAFAIAGGGTGCSSEDDEGTSPNVEFRGDYRPTVQGSGEIGLLTFVGGAEHTYRLTPTSCTEDACVERGTFAFDARAKTLQLKNEKTGVTRTLPVKILSTAKASHGGLITTKTGGSLLNGTGNDTVREGQRTTEKTGQATTDKTGQQLADVAKALLEVIQQAQVGKQEMKNDQAQEEADKAKDDAELERLKAEAEKAKAEAEKAQAEADKAKAEAEKAKQGAGNGGGGGGGGTGGGGGADENNGTGDQKGGAAGG